MKRIAIVGCPGSGKSTLAHQLGKILGLPVYSTDSIYWLPGWVKRSADDYRRLHAGLIAKDRWIIDGNSSMTMDERFARADTIIFLDFPRWYCMFFIWWRAISHVLFRTKREEVAPGCYEKLNGKFLELVRYVWRFTCDRIPLLQEKLKALQKQKRIVVLKNRSEIRQFLRSL